MKSFNTWIQDTHPEILDEDWRNWAKGAAIAGALGAGAMGYGRGSNSTEAPPSNIPQTISFKDNIPQTINFKDNIPQNINVGNNDYFNVSPKDAKNGVTVDTNYHWNSELGRYKAIEQNGQTLYQSKNGTFKKVPSKLSPQGFKFIRVS
jgi:hypothetical protein